MIRYLFSIGSLVFCLGYPLQAKDITHSAPVPSSVSKKKEASSSVSPIKDQSRKTSTIANQKESKSSSCATTSTSSSKKHETSGPTARPTSPSSIASSSSDKHPSTVSHASPGCRLARVTAYWAGEGDYYTGHGLSSTGVHLHGGHCAVDPRIIPYGSVVKIAGVGTYLAVDTGSAVISREAARETGHTAEERNALVVDLFFEHRSEGERFAANGPKFASITWEAPRSADNEAKDKRNLYAEESLEKVRNNQL
ncbi:MAG TPA: 3D domain-containing protein [Candidatus Methylacidiphilales bacterium]